jgi:hypothetical protein
MQRAALPQEGCPTRRRQRPQPADPPGPLSVLVGTSGALGFGVVWQLAAAVVLTIPVICVAFPQRR